ncbi:hypothetical protein [Haliangium sp.]|uniref:hypothetical protein n=1 Tax=Haliangium sp. TaxID=2663208 RepID=UPI003D0D91F6
MDPRGIGSVAVELNNTAAQLLAKLCVELDSQDPAGVLSRALGLLEMSLRAKRRGERLCFQNHRGELSDVVF